MGPHSANVLFPEFSAQNTSGLSSSMFIKVRLLLNLRLQLLLAFLPGAALPAQVTLPNILASHMVVQRDLPVHVWGLAAPWEPISVSFRGETRSTKAGPLGKWSVYLPPGAAGGPFQLTVDGISRSRRQ